MQLYESSDTSVEAVCYTTAIAIKYVVWSIKNTGRFFSHRKCYMLANINKYLWTNSEWRQIKSLRERCLVSTEAETAHWFLDEREGSFLFQRIERHNDTWRHDTITFLNRRPRYWEHSKANGCGFYEVIHSIPGYSVTNIPQLTCNTFLWFRDSWIFLERRRHRLHVMLWTGWL